MSKGIFKKNYKKLTLYIKSPRVFNQVEMNCIFVACLFVVALFWTCDAKIVSLCSESELSELQLKQSQCLKKEEEHYKHLPVSLILSPENATTNANKNDSKVLLLCNMMKDLGENCARPFQKCLDEKQYR